MRDFGKNRDGGVYVRSDRGRGMETRTLPPSISLSGPAHLNNVPLVMVGDAAFPLKPYSMRPYSRQNLTHPKRIFNYRLSRARMELENAFGILASRWRIFHCRINLHPQHSVVAACIVHNHVLDPSKNQRLLD